MLISDGSIVGLHIEIYFSHLDPPSRPQHPLKRMLAIWDWSVRTGGYADSVMGVGSSSGLGIIRT
jgi:hypothetical protein